MRYGTVDVLILGAGPAGCVAATALRHLGDRVLVCDGSASGRRGEPNWVETYGPSVISAAHALGLEHRLASATVGSVRRFVRDGSTSPLTSSAGDESDPEHVHVDRSLFDAGLREQVLASGVRLTEAKVLAIDVEADGVSCSLADGATIKAGVVLDATGRSRGILKGRRELLSPPLLISTGTSSTSASSGVATTFHSRKWGWIWRTNSCGNRVHWTALSSTDHPMSAELEKLIATSDPEGVVHRAATWQVHLDTYPRILQIGDASGSLDPASGSGMSNAFATAIAASRVALEVAAGDDQVVRRSKEFHDWRLILLLRQADELARRYAASGIVQGDDVRSTAA